MNRSSLVLRALALLLLLGLGACGDEVIVQGVDVEKGTLVGGEAAEVDDLGDGPSNEGGPPDIVADLGPNAPGYIP